MANRVVVERMIVTVDDGVARRRPDPLAAEEPLEVRVNGEAVAVTMRTPGRDFELALGFCLAEGIVDTVEAVATVGYCTASPGAVDPAPTDAFNVVDVRLRDPSPVAARLRRHVPTTSACGMCGTTSLAAVRRGVPEVAGDGLRVSARTLTRLPGELRAAQSVFDRTGGLHAAALFGPDGDLHCLREDVGRHNAVDKVVGWAAGDRRLPLGGHVLMVSGRVAFEIVQKALVAGIPLVAAVSAPTSLAVSLAESAGMTLVGFLRGPSMNVYSAPERVLTT